MFSRQIYLCCMEKGIYLCFPSFLKTPILLNSKYIALSSSSIFPSDPLNTFQMIFGVELLL